MILLFMIKKTYLTLGITTAVELSYLNKLDFNSLEKILDEKKGNQNDKITFDREKIEAVLPKELLKRDKRYIEKYIIEAIENYQNKIH